MRERLHIINRMGGAHGIGTLALDLQSEHGEFLLDLHVERGNGCAVITGFKFRNGLCQPVHHLEKHFIQHMRMAQQHVMAVVSGGACVVKRAAHGVEVSDIFGGHDREVRRGSVAGRRAPLGGIGSLHGISIGLIS